MTQPTTTDERSEVAGVCMINLKFEMPILFDNMDNEVDGNYAAMPERLYVIDPEGKMPIAARWVRGVLMWKPGGM